MKTYSEKLKDPRWQKMRLRILDRDAFTCRDCGTKKETLHVHHTLYEKGNPWDTEERFMITVCEACHGRRETVEAKLRKEAARLFINLPVAGLEALNTYGLVYSAVNQLVANGIGLLTAESSVRIRGFWERTARAIEKKVEAKE